MNKIFFFFLLVLGLSVSDYAISSSEECVPSSAVLSSSVASSSKNFCYQKEVFELYQTSDISSESPSFKTLRQDALARETHLISLFDFVRTNGLNKNVQNLFRSYTDLSNAQRELQLSSLSTRQQVTHHLDPRLIILAGLKTDYAVERDLVSYFARFLENFSQNRPSLEQIQNLYEQSVFVVRLNMQSLVEKMFQHMALAYPKNFKKIGEAHDQMCVYQDGLCVFGDEDNCYYDYFKAYAGTNVMRDDTVDITKRVRFFLNREGLKDPGVVYELNSVLFYLNVERALLSFCPDLTFTPGHYPLDSKSRGVCSDRFILSKLINLHETGFLANLLSEWYVDPKKSQSYLSPKMVTSVLSASAQKDIAHFLSKVFPEEKREKSQKASALQTKAAKHPSSYQPKGKGTAKGRKKTQKTFHSRAIPSHISQQHTAQEPMSSSSSAPLVSKENAFGEDSEHVALFSNFEDVTPVRVYEADEHSDSEEEYAEEEDLDSLLTNSSDTMVQSATSSSVCLEEVLPDQDSLTHDDYVFKNSLVAPRPASSKRRAVRQPKLPYKAHLTYDDYVFKRSITTRSSPTYSFYGNEYSFRVRPFNLETMREIKELTHHTAERLPNVASYTLRFHWREGKDDVYQDFVSQDLYLSGGHYFDDERDRSALKVQNAYHTILTHDQRDIFRRTDPRKRGIYIGKKLEEKVRENIVGGAWKNNCLDAEVILLLDLNNKMPKYLKSLARQSSQDAELMAVSLGVATYYDVCWRCRNLLQGWQWGLKDFIAHERPSMKISPDFSTLVMGMGEVRPQSHESDLHPPRFFDSMIALDLGSPHKLAAVKMRR